MLRPLKHFIFKIRRLIQFFPVIWNDYDWTVDTHLQFLAIKIKNYRKYVDRIVEDGFALHEKKYSGIALKMIERLIEEGKNDYEGFYKESRKIIQKHFYSPTDAQIVTHFSDEFDVTTWNTKKWDSETNEKLYRDTLKKEEAYLKKYYATLFSIMGKRSMGWWI